MPDYLPRQEGQRVAWAGRLARALVDSAGAYGVSAPEAVAFEQLQQQAAQAWLISQTERTRTRITVQAKDTAMAALVKDTRRLVKGLRAYLTQSEHGADRAQLLAQIGLRPTNLSRTRLRVPTAPPNLYLSPTMRGGLRLEVRDPAHAQRKAMPRGAMMVYVYTSVRSAQTGAWSGWRLGSVKGVTEFEVDAPADAQPGDRVRVSVCWASPTCVVGPTSLPVEIVLGPVYAMRVKRELAA